MLKAFVLSAALFLSLAIFGRLSFAQQALNWVNEKQQYTIFVGTAPGESLAVLLGIDAWNRLLNKEFIVQTDNLDTADIIAVSAPISESLGGLSTDSIFGGHCFLQMNMNSGFNVGTAVHELGHCIGLGHSSNPKSIMYWKEIYGQVIDTEMITPIQMTLGKP